MNTNTRTAREVSYDIGLLFPVLFLVGVGIVMVYSASSAVALKKFGSDYLFLKKQAVFALIGLVGLVVCRHFPYRWYRPLVYPSLGLALASLIAIHVTDLGLNAGGSARWLDLGAALWLAGAAGRGASPAVGFKSIATSCASSISPP